MLQKLECMKLVSQTLAVLTPRDTSTDCRYTTPANRLLLVPLTLSHAAVTTYSAYAGFLLV